MTLEEFIRWRRQEERMIHGEDPHSGPSEDYEFLGEREVMPERENPPERSAPPERAALPDEREPSPNKTLRIEAIPFKI